MNIIPPPPPGCLDLTYSTASTFAHSYTLLAKVSLWLWRRTRSPQELIRAKRFGAASTQWSLVAQCAGGDR